MTCWFVGDGEGDEGSEPGPEVWRIAAGLRWVDEAIDDGGVDEVR